MCLEGSQLPIPPKHELVIEVEDYDYKCGDGCCSWYGTRVTVNGVRTDCENHQDVGSHLKSVLTLLGYEVKVLEKSEGEVVGEY